MNKEKLSELIQTCADDEVLEALCEFYELKFMTKPISTITTNSNPYPFSVTNVAKSTGFGRSDNG